MSTASPKTMKAAISPVYGSSDKIEIVEKLIPDCGRNQVLVKNTHAALTTADAMMRAGQPKFARLFLGTLKPKNPNLGTGFSGRIVAVGESVSKFSIGDLVFGETGLDLGANAEYLTIDENAVVIQKPDFIDEAHAACICDGPLTTYNFLVKIAQIKKGDRVLINGACGALGSFAIDLALAKGAKVTATASQKNHEFLMVAGRAPVIPQLPLGVP